MQLLAFDESKLNSSEETVADSNKKADWVATYRGQWGQYEKTFSTLLKHHRIVPDFEYQ